MPNTSTILLIAAVLVLCGILCAVSFKFSYKNPWLGFAIGLVLGPLGFLLALAIFVLGRSSTPDNTGTFAPPRRSRAHRQRTPEPTGAFSLHPKHKEGQDEKT